MAGRICFAKKYGHGVLKISSSQIQVRIPDFAADYKR